MFVRLFITLLCLIYGAASEGESCFQNGVPGTCKLLTRCLSVYNNPKTQWWKLTCAMVWQELHDIKLQKRWNNIPQRCGFKDVEPIICCVEAPGTTTTPRPVATTTRRVSSTTEYVPPQYDYVANMPTVDECAPLSENVTPAKTGRKAWDKCIEYQQALVYPCEEQAAIVGGLGRSNYCKHQTDKLIVGGEDAARDEFPHMVLLGYGQSNGSAVWQCGGTLLSDRFILTAGHCTSSRDVGPVTYAIVGSLKRTDDVSSSQVYRIKAIHKNPRYKAPSKYHDIALLETDKPIALSPIVVPACLDVFGGDAAEAVATGWGATAWRGQIADTLQKVILKRFKQEECNQKYPVSRYMAQGFDPTTQVCYGDYNLAADTCQGDSGGPLTTKNHRVHCMYTVVGVTSFGKACGNAKDPGMYTRVSAYVPWIEQVVWG